MLFYLLLVPKVPSAGDTVLGRTRVWSEGML